MSNTVPTKYASVPFEEYEALLELRAAVRRITDPDSSTAVIGSMRGDPEAHMVDRVREVLDEIDARIQAARSPVGGQQ